MNTATTLDHVAAPLRTAQVGVSQTVIDIEGLNVSYGSVHAVKNLTLQVRQGEIFGLLGPNGAGKTTALSAIEGLVKPQSGRITVLGHDALRHPDAVKRRCTPTLC